MVDAAALSAAIAAVCPVVGVSVVDPSNRSTWRIDFDPSATATQQTAARQIVAAWIDPVPVRQFTGTQFMTALIALGVKSFFDNAATADTAKPIDVWYYRALTPNDWYSENNAKLNRLCSKAVLLGAAAIPPVTFTLASIVDSAVTQ